MTRRRGTLGGRTYEFADLRALLAAATRNAPATAGRPRRLLEQERVAAQATLADLPLETFLREQVVPYEDDEVTRLIIDGHDGEAFAPIASLTVGALRTTCCARRRTPPRSRPG